MLKIERIKALSDNYIHILIYGNKAIVIDPGSAEIVLRKIEQRNLVVEAILNTHHHFDHVAGNQKIKKVTRCKIYGTGRGLPHIDYIVKDISRVKALEREKDNLISMFAHDMKSSLTIIGGFALRLLKKLRGIDEAKQEEYLEIIKNESGKLELLINDFLEFSRLQTGKLKLNLAATSLDKELMEILDSYRLRASESGIKLELQNEEALPIIEADAHKLRRVFTNLVDNALKFSKEKGTITVTTEETATEVMVKMEDEGIGIPSDELPYVFDAFHRGSGTQEKRGFGLGLAGVKTIIEAHGGRVWAESEGYDEEQLPGSTFHILLPARRPDSLI